MLSLGIPFSAAPWGRTDFPGGSSSALVTSVRRLLKELPAETEVYPGHENDTSIEQERCWNPYA